MKILELVNLDIVTNVWEIVIMTQIVQMVWNSSSNTTSVKFQGAQVEEQMTFKV